MSTRPHVGDIGTPFVFTCVQEDGTVINLTAATEKVVTFVRPDGTTFDRDLETVSAAAGTARYITVEDDLDVHGTWKVQAFIETPDGEWRSDIERFTVHRNVTRNEVS
jgi:hypothetical protein